MFESVEAGSPGPEPARREAGEQSVLWAGGWGHLDVCGLLEEMA